MYHQINPTEMFRERELALLNEAEDRRLVRRPRMEREPKLRSRTAAALGFLAAVVVAGLILVASSSPAHADATFTVNFNGDFEDINVDDGICDVTTSTGEVCTLRAAIQESNAAFGGDTINFNIPEAFRDPNTGVATISPNSELPTITDKVIIDGYTQPDSSPNTLAKGTNAVLKIELDGRNAGSVANGLTIASNGPVSPNTVVKGLAINRFKGDGIEIIGDTPDTTIGSNNRIEGNFIGTDPSGTRDRGNGGAGVFIVSGGGGRAAFNTVGGISPDKRNLISGNGGDGVSLIGELAGGNRVLGNLIGTKKDGTTALGNSFSGVGIFGAPGNVVGDDSFEGANTIAFNGSGGVLVGNIATSTTGNRILRNSIFSNAGLGIDLGNDGPTPNDARDTDEGPNTLQNKPVLSSAKTVSDTTTIKGTLNSTPNHFFHIQFFSNLSGNEGKKFIGQKVISTDGSGNVTFNFKPKKKVAAGRPITATATDGLLGNTSEFSAPRTVASS